MIPGQNPYLLVVGCQRSGTTLLQRMLDHHPHLAVGYDSHFIPRPIKRLPVGVNPLLTPEIVDEVRQFPRFARLGLPDSAARDAAASARTYGEFVSTLYDAFGRLHGKPLAGEKSPGYCRHLPHLHALFPWVRTIHLIRDGRDVALSILDWKKGPTKLELFHEEPIGACALWWRRDVTMGRQDGAQIGPEHYCEIQYETLVAEPERSMRTLSTFLDLPFAQEMVTFHEGKVRSRAGRSAKAAWLPPTQGLRDWRTQMSERDVQLFEALAGDVLTDLGYPRVADRVSPEIEAAATRCRDWWDANLRPGHARTGVLRRDTATPDVSAAGAETGPNPYVFIVGCPRSGTTLLKRIVDAHPDIAITPETHWIPRFVRKSVGISADGMVTSEFATRLLEYHKFANLRIDRAELERLLDSSKPLSYAEAVARIFDAFGEHRGKRLVGDKTPGYVQHVPMLHGLWPRARFVHLVRDGRDVCLSLLDWARATRTVGRFATWADEPVATAALWWERFVRLGCESAAGVASGLYHELRYEEMVADPVAACRTLSEFLDIAYDEAMVRFHEGRTRPDAGLSPKRAWQPITSGIRDWRSQMSDGDVELFEAVAGDLLSELGYERGCPEPSEASLERAAQVRDRFSKDPNFKERSVPASWVTA